MLVDIEWALSQAMNCPDLPRANWSETFGPEVEVWRSKCRAPCFDLFWHWRVVVPSMQELPESFTNSRVVHLVRNPMEILANAYFYHKNKCTERWNEEPMKDVCSWERANLKKVCRQLDSEVLSGLVS